MVTRESVTRTIRIDARYDEVIKKIADERGYSVNALMDQILKKWVDIWQFSGLDSWSRISEDTIMMVFNLLKDEDIETIATHLGVDEINSQLMMRGKKIDIDSVLWYIKNILGDSNGWFTCQVNMDQKDTKLHLTHKRGYKWSIFIMNYIKSIIENKIGIHPSVVIFTNSVNIQFNSNQTKV